jgi:hypothetical protein
MNLLSLAADAKTIKGQKFGYYTGIQYLAPAGASGVINTCASASNGCREACLFTAGRAGIFKKINEARVRKTILFAKTPETYFPLLVKDIESLIKKASKDNMTPCVRPNGTSDIMWEIYRKNLGGKNIFELFPSIQFYDYTKHFKRMMDFLSGKLPSNYYLTFSRSEDNQAECEQVLKAGGNIAVVFEKTLPETYLGYKVINGDETDLRFTDEKNVVVGLKAKGKAKKDLIGFIVKS